MTHPQTLSTLPGPESHPPDEHTHTLTQTHLFTHIGRYTHSHPHPTHSQICRRHLLIYLHIHTNTQSHTHTQTHLDAHTFTHYLTSMHTLACTHTCTLSALTRPRHPCNRGDWPGPWLAAIPAVRAALPPSLEHHNSYWLNHSFPGTYRGPSEGQELL